MFPSIAARVRQGLKKLAAQSAAQLYLAAKFSRRSAVQEKSASRRGIPILNLHRVSSQFPRHSMTMHPVDFRRLLVGLKQKYRFISLRELDGVLERGSNQEDLACLTFDDCYGCNYTHALPILQELQVPATFFVSTRFIDSKEPFPHDIASGHRELPNFTSAQIREMASLPGLEIGSHSVTHYDFSKGATHENAMTELAQSRVSLEQITGRAVTRFAIPWGSLRHCTAQVIDGAKAAGYERVYSHFGGRNLVAPKGGVGYVLHRVCSQGDPDYVRACLEGYRGRFTLIPGGTDRSNWPREFHPTDIRWV
jgi:peptidoglycan/xylan/chitin deacetylase (PgdA/CDA1 family)